MSWYQQRMNMQRNRRTEEKPQGTLRFAVGQVENPGEGVRPCGLGRPL
jgi:hypothetical protein